MRGDPLSTVREARLCLTKWLDAVRTMPDPSAQGPDAVQQLSVHIEAVSRALNAAQPALTATEQWKSEIAAYTEILQELRARLANFEMTLRIRQNQVRGARANLRAARSWSDLAKYIG
jgi:hypothetical protein